MKTTKAASATQNESLRHRLWERLHRLRRKSRDPSDDANIDLAPRTQVDLKLEANIDSNSQHATFTASSLPLNGTGGPPKGSTTSEDITQTQIDQSAAPKAVYTSGPEQISFANHSTLDNDIDVVVLPSDIWSKAYDETVKSLGKDIDNTILKGENVAQLFRQLEEIDKEATQESAFLRSVRYLHSLQIPLERFKLALDLASPLTNIEPTTATVFGVVRSVTAITISFTTADLDFAN